MDKSLTYKQSISVQNKLNDCEKLFEFLVNFVGSNKIPDSIYNDLRLIIEETFTNIANYAHDDDAHAVTIELDSTDDTISLTFTDTGISFNPITDCNRDIEKDDHCEGGMGIHIIKSLSDHLKYERIDQRNVFTVTKYYTK